MAKRKGKKTAKSKVNKSQKVRDYLAKHPNAMPAETADALKEFGISPNFVSNIKYALQTKQRGKRVGRRTAPSSGDELLAAAELIALCGGADDAKAALRPADQVAKALG